MHRTVLSFLSRPGVIVAAALLLLAGISYATLFDYEADIQLTSGSSFERMSFSPDGSTLAIADSFGAELIAFPAYERTTFVSFDTRPRGDIAAWSPDIARIAIVDRAETGVEIWDVGLGRRIRHLESDEVGRIVLEQTDNVTLEESGPGTIIELEWSPDGRYITIGRFGGSIDVWDLETNRLRQLFDREHSTAGSCLAFSPDGEMQVARGIVEQQAVLFGVPDFEQLGVLDPQGFCDDLQFHPNGRAVAIFEVSGQGRVEVWDVESRTLTMIHEIRPHAVAWHPHAELLAVASYERVELLRPADQSRMLLGELSDSWVSSLIFSPDGQHILIGDNKGALRAWSLAERAPALER